MAIKNNTDERIKKELMNLLEDPKYCRTAWKSIGQMLLARPAVHLPVMLDKDGNETLASKIDTLTYDTLSKNVEDIREGKAEPTELEMILASQMVKARFDTQAATFIRDTVGARPVDESKVEAQVSNPYEALTDAELEALAEYRAAHGKTEEAEDK